MPAGDIDVLFRERADVDAWADALAPICEVETAPAFIANACQYFARVLLDGTVVELSTVEIATTKDTIETFGPGPWTHFDAVPIAGTEIALVASELRLLTELARSRPDRYRPLIAHLRSTGADVDLVERGLVSMGAHEEVIARVLTRLTPVAD